MSPVMPNLRVYMHREALDEAERLLAPPTLVSSLTRALQQGLERTRGSRVKRLRGLGTTSERRLRTDSIRSVYSDVVHADGERMLFVHSVSPRSEAYTRDAFRARIDRFHAEVWDRSTRSFRVEVAKSVYSEIPYATAVPLSADSIIADEPYLTNHQHAYSTFLLPLGENASRGDPFAILGHGPPGSGKTLVLQDVAIRAMEEQNTVLVLVPSARLLTDYQMAFADYGIEPRKLADSNVDAPCMLLEDVRTFFAERCGDSAQPSERREAVLRWWDRCYKNIGLRQHVGERQRSWHRRLADLLDALYSDPAFWDSGQSGMSVKDDVDEYNAEAYALLRDLRNKPQWRDLLASERPRDLVLRSEYAERAAPVLDACAAIEGPLLVLVDESQDLAPAEWRTLLTWCAKRRAAAQTRIAFVGDLNQRVSVTPFEWSALKVHACKALGVTPGTAQANALVVERQVEVTSLRFAREIGIVAGLVLDRSVTERGKNRVSRTADPEGLSTRGEVQVVVAKANIWNQAVTAAKAAAMNAGPDSRACLICGDEDAVRILDDSDPRVLVFSPKTVKGLEFSSTVIVHPIEAGLGARAQMTYEQATALYTAVTRARERLLCVLSEREWSCLGRAREKWKSAGVEDVLRCDGDPIPLLATVLPRYVQRMTDADVDTVLASRLDALASGPDDSEQDWIRDIVRVAAQMVHRGLLQEIVTSGAPISREWPSAAETFWARAHEDRTTDPATAVACLLLLGEIAAARQLLEESARYDDEPVCCVDDIQLLEWESPWQSAVYAGRAESPGPLRPSGEVVGHLITKALTREIRKLTTAGQSRSH